MDVCLSNLSSFKPLSKVMKASIFSNNLPVNYQHSGIDDRGNTISVNIDFSASCFSHFIKDNEGKIIREIIGFTDNFFDHKTFITVVQANEGQVKMVILKPYGESIGKTLSELTPEAQNKNNSHLLVKKLKEKCFEYIDEISNIENKIDLEGHRYYIQYFDKEGTLLLSVQKICNYKFNFNGYILDAEKNSFSSGVSPKPDTPKDEEQLNTTAEKISSIIGENIFDIEAIKDVVAKAPSGHMQKLHASIEQKRNELEILEANPENSKSYKQNITQLISDIEQCKRQLSPCGAIPTVSELILKYRKKDQACS